jgi:hypothetical protein
MSEAWERNLEVRVRLAAGKLVLKLPPNAIVLTAEQAWLWHRLDGVATTEEICREAGPDRARVHELIVALASDDFIRPVPSGRHR